MTSWRSLEVPGAVAVALSTAMKVLLWPAYHSTDMEVHRNWLAVTYSLPLREWYIDATSPWTLDYPPFFAYLSWILSQPAAWIDARIVDVKLGLNYDAWSCVAYMRSTVLLTESVLAYALYRLSQCTLGEETQQILLLSVFLHPGLLMVDHIHFQYNGFLFGVLFLSLWAARTQRPLVCALLFSSLLQFKHIYMYMAPAYFVYLLRVYMLPSLPNNVSAMSAAFDRTIKLGFVTLTPFFASIMPFVWDAMHEMSSPSQVLYAMYSRLFPFHRGLMHAYWAPNVWALYAAVDRVLLRIHGKELASTSRGMVGDTVLGILPNISPTTCFVLALTFSLVYVVPPWRRPTYSTLVSCVTVCAMTSFAIGWHVHEKAILMAALPFSLVAHRKYSDWRTFQLLSAVAIVSLFPLLHTHKETPIKLIYAALWYMLVCRTMMRRVLRPMPSNMGIFLHALETAYLYGLSILALVTQIVWPISANLAPESRLWQMEFLPLMLTSVYCAAGFVYCWARLSVTYLSELPTM